MAKSNGGEKMADNLVMGKRGSREVRRRKKGKGGGDQARESDERRNKEWR